MEFQKRTWFTKPPPPLRTAKTHGLHVIFSEQLPGQQIPQILHVRDSQILHVRDPVCSGYLLRFKTFCQYRGQQILAELRKDAEADDRRPERKKKTGLVKDFTKTMSRRPITSNANMLIFVQKQNSMGRVFAYHKIMGLLCVLSIAPMQIKQLRLE
jgi:hypothetical protein